MATVNFSVPEHVKEAFNAAFHGQNKSAIVARLMMQAVEQDERRRERRKAIARILKRRARARPVTAAQFRAERVGRIRRLADQR